MFDSASPVFHFDFLYLFDPAIGHCVEDVMQTVNDKHVLKFLDLYHEKVCIARFLDLYH